MQLGLPRLAARFVSSQQVAVRSRQVQPLKKDQSQQQNNSQENTKIIIIMSLLMMLE
jgi:hypothetical protein